MAAQGDRAQGDRPRGPADVRNASRQQLGTLGEDLAVGWLRDQGLEVVARNWRCSVGELDVVAVETAGDGRRTAVFCEVKSRRGLGFGAPLESITHAKLRTLRQLAACWLRESPVAVDDLRLDGIGVLLEPGRPPRIDHVRGIG